MSATVDARGRVTIPKTTRERLGIVPGDRIDFGVAANGSVVLAKAQRERQIGRFAKLRGHAGKGLSTDAIMALTRGK
jgi:antitoxin PrlF